MTFVEPSLDYFCIYNPDLGKDESTLENQIVFYYGLDEDAKDVGKQLRQIGLAQGMIEFARGFADDQPVSHVETAGSTLIFRKVEEPNWWVCALVRHGEFRNDDGAPEPTTHEMAAPWELAGHIESAYRRWRLHHGTFSDALEHQGRSALVDSVQPWWKAWAQCFSVLSHGGGVPSVLCKVRMARGEVAPETEEATAAIIGRQGVFDMVVTRHGSELPMNDGCVWRGQAKLHADSLADLVAWVDDCARAGNDAAFNEPSGFMYHLRRPESETTVSGHDGDDVDTSALSRFVPTMTAAMDSAIGSMSNLMGRVPWRSTSQTPQPIEKPGLEDLNDSKFLVGYGGDLEHDPAGPELDRITTKQLHLQTAHADRSPGPYEKYNVVLFRRRPFIFTLIYTPDTEPQDAPSFRTLYKRLVSISEPLYRDVSDEIADEAAARARFYYLTIDERHGILQSSLPFIPPYMRPPELELIGEDRARRAVMERLDIIHIHQHIIELLSGVVDTEQDRFVRTARNWCLFWSRLPQNRQVVFVKKFSRNTQPALDSADFLVSLGKDAKHWLDHYKHYGKV